MKKQNYSKPFMVAEKFIPQNYCWVCYEIHEGGVWAPRKETNGIPGCQVTGVSPNYKDLGNTVSIPADLEGRNPDGMKYLRCDPAVYYTKSSATKDGETIPDLEAYYQHDTGGYVWNFHTIEGEVYYMLYNNYTDRTATNHS